MSWNLKILTGLVILVNSYAIAHSQLPSDTDLVVYYPFTTEATDQSIKGFHGQLFGDAYVDYRLFIGYNAVDRVKVPHEAMDGLENFTISFFTRLHRFHTEGSYPSNSVISGSNISESNAFSIGYGSYDNRWAFGIDNEFVHFSFSTDPDLQWHHIAFVRDGQNISFYYDNSFVETQILYATAPLKIGVDGLYLGQEQDAYKGQFDKDQALDGELDDFRVYDRPLTEQEIAEVYLAYNWLSDTLTPEPPVVQDLSICAGQDASFFAEGMNVRWYQDPDIDTLIVENNTLQIIQPQAGNYSYFATQERNGIESEAVEVDLVVNNIPAVPATPVGPSSVCGRTYSTMVFSAGSSEAENYQWRISPEVAGVVSNEGTLATIRWDEGFSGPAEIQVAALISHCSSDWSDVLNIVVNEAQVIQVSDTVCPGDSVSFMGQSYAAGKHMLSTYKEGCPTEYLLTVNEFEQPTMDIDFLSDTSYSPDLLPIIDIQISGEMDYFIFKYPGQIYSASEIMLDEQDIYIGQYTMPVILSIDRMGFSAYAVSEAGCIDSVSYTFSEILPENVEIELQAEFLTPNGDGINDYFIIKNIDLFSEIYVRIADQAGNMILETENYKNDWGGTFESYDPLNPGAYFYFIRAEGSVNVAKKRGVVNILTEK